MRLLRELRAENAALREASSAAEEELRVAKEETRVAAKLYREAMEQINVLDGDIDALGAYQRGCAAKKAAPRKKTAKAAKKKRT